MLEVLEDMVISTRQYQCLRHDDTVGHGDTEEHSGAGDTMISIKDTVMLKFTETLWDTVMPENMLTGGYDNIWDRANLWGTVTLWGQDRHEIPGDMVILGTCSCGRHDGMGDTMMPISMVVLRAVWCSLPL